MLTTTLVCQYVTTKLLGLWQTANLSEIESVMHYQVSTFSNLLLTYMFVLWFNVEPLQIEFEK